MNVALDNPADAKLRSSSSASSVATASSSSTAVSKALAIDTMDDAPSAAAAAAADASPSRATSWLSLSDADFPSSASTSSLDLATYAPPHMSQQQRPESPGFSLDERARGFSMSSSASGVTLEDDIRSIGDQMRRVLAFCELQSQNPIRLQAKINDLQEQLQLAVAEKNYWMKRCKEMSRSAKHEFPLKEVDESDPDARTRPPSCYHVPHELHIRSNNGLTYRCMLSQSSPRRRCGAAPTQS